MREVNFSIPNANKASVGITTALYDRRALDCTSTLPLINSLNHLAYLTTSSARIRDILTVDGGIERLVCMLKEGRSKNVMEMWKWNLAFQCVFNIGVRGSESVRTRLVEADMVPVIATILDNYISVIDKCREKEERSMRRRDLGSSSRHHTSRQSAFSSGSSSRTERSRRAVPPPIEIPAPFGQGLLEAPGGDATPTPAFSLSSPPERTTFSHSSGGHHHRGHEDRSTLYSTPGGGIRNIAQPLNTAMPTMETTDQFPLRPVRDADRLPSMLPALQGEMTSQPVSPTTPSAVLSRQNSGGITTTRTPRRPSIRHQLSMSGESEVGAAAEQLSAEAAHLAGVPDNEPMVGIQNDINMGEINMTDIANADLLDGGATPVAIAAPPPGGADGGHQAFNMEVAHRTALDVSLVATANPRTTLPMANFSPVQPPNDAINAINTNPPPLWYARNGRDVNASAGMIAAMPRDEDVLMSLQLLAYVSKYTNLRAYFQNSHLVPKLKIGADLQLFDGEHSSHAPANEDPEEELSEYELPDDFNIFPLVEKFTVRHHTQDMQYWASVVMRNLCRKDDSRGGIRQCAYYQCGKWEDKECQKSAWVYHRHWCVPAN
ncbi:hypothetical protein M011DRAFT_407425 [Sporormia fimetaria CBS 119925]|uniref:MYND-type zinc finger protein MUB1 n=1 Tax=Sporormia fimetaria CBS 119925 TaxID=1340428 RepID=A0A6A6V4Z7_9PLEO|nr:hypothetical protein M011DRAFT_407425 [Sporormia fimetaria CBS 119925]